MTTRLYRSFILTRGNRRQCWIAQHEDHREDEFVAEDLGEIESAIDRFYEDMHRDAVAAVDAQGAKLDATLDQIDAHGACWASGRQRMEGSDADWFLEQARAALKASGEPE